MKKSLVVVSLVAVAAVAFSGCRHGGDRMHRMEQMIAWKLDDALDGLDATEAQREALVAEWGASRVDPVKVHAVVDERAEAYRAFAHKVADALVEVHALLTPEQRAKVQERVQRHRR
jgi:periplasmic protein CpxP/Spy